MEPISSFPTQQLPAIPLISGRFIVLDTAPDGDSLQFQPHRLTPWLESHPQLRWHPQQRLGVRLDGIDAMETHYLAGSSLGVLRQPAPWPERAAQSLLEFLGFTAICRGSAERVLKACPLATEGAIALRQVDRYGRALAWGFRGRFRQAPALLTLTPRVVECSVNARLLELGLSYPALYRDMPPWLWNWIRARIQRARQRRIGLWGYDQTGGWSRVSRLSDLTQQLIWWPKLFRRLADEIHCEQITSVELERACATLCARIGSVWLWRSQGDAPFACLLQRQDQKLRFAAPPEEVAFYPEP